MNLKKYFLSLIVFTISGASLTAIQVREELIQKMWGKEWKKSAEELIAAKKVKEKSVKAKTTNIRQLVNQDFRNFLGFWQLETMDDWVGLVLVQFYEEEGIPKAKFYGGTQNNIREINEADYFFGLVFGYSSLFAVPPGDINVCDVEILDNTSLRLLNTFQDGYLSTDQLTSTFKIQSYDSELAFMELWTNWDGVADNQSLGTIETLMRFRKLDRVPEIQTIDQPTTKWDNPVNIFNYMYDAFTYLGENERRDSADCQQYIGNVAFEQLRDQLLTTGVTRINTITTEKRNGKYIGVWRTNNEAGVTTLRLADQNYFQPIDILSVSGFTGAYAVLNGTHNASLYYQGSVGPQYGDEWVLPGSMIPTLHIDFDSSKIAEEYDPHIHGVGVLIAQHGPVKVDTEYRELMTAVGELVSAFGIATHTRARVYVQFDPVKRIDTYAELAEVIANDNFDFISLRGRSYGQAQGQDYLYFNPALNPTVSSLPNFDINDPFGLGTEVFNPPLDSKWNYDIDIENYLEKSYNIWFAVTGPVLEQDPITSLLEADFGSNGSQIRFTVARVGTTPEPLVDAYGTHPYTLYQSTLLGNESAANQFVGGIVKRSYTGRGRCHKRNGEVVAYIRWGNDLGFEPNFLSYRASVFGRNDMPEAKMNSNEIAALAALLEKLNKYKPTRYIIDIRENGGGTGSFTNAYGTLFGGNRGSYVTKLTLDFANDPQRTQLINNSAVETVFNSAVSNTALAGFVNTDLTAKIFPRSIVRGSCSKKIDLVILTNVNAASAGDLFTHNYIGPNAEPKEGIQDLGHHVRFQIVGSIDGRLYNGLSYGTTPISNPNPYKYLGEIDLPLIHFTYEAGILLANDRHGILCNQQTWTQPSKLVPSWYEKQWQDIGAIKPVYKYPLKTKKSKPDLNSNKTWRDLALEYAITNK